MSEIDVLTARLDIEGLAAFSRGMAQADASVDTLRKNLRGLTEDALAARAALSGLGVDLRSIADAAALADEIKRIRDEGTKARAVVKDLGPTDSSIAKTAALAAEMGHVRDNAIEARAAARSIGGRSIPFGGGNLVGSAFGARDFGPIRGAGEFGLSGGSLARDVESRARRDLSSTGLLGMFFGSGEARRIAGAATRGGGGGGGGGFLQGILPGGQRANAGLVAAGIGLAAAAGPALVPAAAGILASGINVFGTLAGTALTLKLALGGLNAAALTTTAGWNALTPVQKTLGLTLRQLDAGLVANLEATAQNAVIPGLNRALHLAVTPSSVGALNTTVGAFGQAISGGAQQFGKFLGGSGSGITAGFDQRLQHMLVADAAGFRDLIRIIIPLTDAFVRLGNAALPLTRWLGDATTKGAQAFDQFVKLQGASGGLATFFDKSRQSLQALGGLLGSLGNLALQVGDAISFKASVGLINDVSGALNDLAGFLQRNRKLFNDVFGGLVLSLRDGIRAISALLGALRPVLSEIDRLAGGLKGVRLAVDGLAVYWVGKFLLMRLAVVGLIPLLGSLATAIPYVAVGVALIYIIEHWKQVTQAFPLLWRAAWDVIKGDLDIGVYYIFRGLASILVAVDRAFNWVPIIGGQLDSVTQQFQNWVGQFKVAGQSQFGSAGLLAGQAWGTLFNAGVSQTWVPPGAQGPVGKPSSGMPPGLLGPIKGATPSAFLPGQSPFATPAPLAPGFGGTTFPPIWQLPARYALPIALAAQAGALNKPGAVAQQIRANQAALNYTLRAEKGLTGQNQLAAISEATSLAQTLASLRGTGASTSGVGFLSPGVRARLAAAQNAAAGITAGTAPTTTTIQAQLGLFTQLSAAVKQLTDAIKAGTYAGKQLTAAQTEQSTLIKQQKAAQAALQGSKQGLAVERLLGIAGSGSQTGAQGARSLQANLRDFLNTTLKQFGLAQTGSAPLGPFVTELRKLGDTNKRQHQSLEKILAAIHLLKNDKQIGSAAVAAATQNGSQRLAEIKQELQKSTGFTTQNAVNANQILRAYGIDPTKFKGRAAEALSRTAAFWAGNPVSLARGAVFGVPLTPTGEPAFVRHAKAAVAAVRAAHHAIRSVGGVPVLGNQQINPRTGKPIYPGTWGPMVPLARHVVHLTVEVKGNTRIDKENARLIANELRRKTARNSVQMTGSNAGVNMGF